MEKLKIRSILSCLVQVDPDFDERQVNGWMKPGITESKQATFYKILGRFFMKINVIRHRMLYYVLSN